MRTKKCRFVFLLFSTCKKEAYRSRSGAKKLDCSITGNITLTKQNSNGIDYIYDCDEEIYCGAYTIPKSGIAEFLNEDGIRGTNSGVLTVNGSAGDPIITRTSKSTQMYRLGLSFENNDTANELNYLQISNIKLNTARVKRAENELAKVQLILNNYKSLYSSGYQLLYNATDGKIVNSRHNITNAYLN